ncbi:nicotinamide riboside kinase 1 isoform X5 [Dromiciops gliroides]|nr:nicotinamide riboside kinase 1 isoform X5 [Dromiciops gliroides]
MKAFVVGISGVTNGGKTTLAKKLQKQLPNCSVISQDDYFKPESEIKIDENGFLQYDELEALNMETLMSAVHSWIKNPRNSLKSDGPEGAEEVPILIIEGFLLYNYKPLDTIWNRSYFLTIPYEECKRRRRSAENAQGTFQLNIWGPMRSIKRVSIRTLQYGLEESKEDIQSHNRENDAHNHSHHNVKKNNTARLQLTVVINLDSRRLMMCLSS